MASTEAVDEQEGRLPDDMLQGLAHKSILIPRSSFTLGNEIGRGAFSKVYLGNYQGTPVAVKKQTISEENPEKYLLTELGILHGVRHTNLIKYFGASFENKNIFIVTELMTGGELAQLVRRDDLILPWKLRVRIARDIAAGLCYLHERQLLHRDIKPDNVLIDDDWRPVLSDYGFARKRETSRAMTICGTEEYMAPEMIWGEDYDERVDVFSFGMLMVELITRKRPGKAGFLERTPRTKFQLDLEQLDAAVPEDCPPSFVECCKQCLEYEPDDRLDSDSMLEWLSDLYGEMEGPEDAPKPTDVLGAASLGTADHVTAQQEAAAAAVAAAVAGGAGAGAGGPKLPAAGATKAKPFKPMSGLAEEVSEEA